MVAVEVKKYFEVEARERQQATQAKPGEKVGSKVQANLPEPSDKGQARDKAAAALNVSPRSVQHASRFSDCASETRRGN